MVLTGSHAFQHLKVSLIDPSTEPTPHSPQLKPSVGHLYSPRGQLLDLGLDIHRRDVRNLQSEQENGGFNLKIGICKMLIYIYIYTCIYIYVYIYR